MQPDVFRSDDEAATWTRVSPRLAAHNTHPVTLDPMVATDRETGRVFTADDLFPTGCSQFATSDDGGRSWNESTAGCQVDHETIFTGHPTTSAGRMAGYPNVVYYCGAFGGDAYTGDVSTSCFKSLDGGHSFVLTGTPAFDDLHAPPGAVGDFGLPGNCGGLSGHGVSDGAGTIYLPRGWCGEPYLAISHDEGATWTRVQVADNGMAINAFGWRDTNAGVGVDDRGRLSYAWIGRDRLPYMATSADGGATWSAPVMLAPRNVNETSLASLAVSPDGTAALAYMGTTNSPGAAGFGERPTCTPGDPHKIDQLLDPLGCAETGAEQSAGLEPVPPAYAHTTWNAYLTLVRGPLSRTTTVETATLNDPAHPLIYGDCGPIRCREEWDFIDVTTDNRGRPWVALVNGVATGACTPPAFPSKEWTCAPDSAHEGAIAWLSH